MNLAEKQGVTKDLDEYWVHVTNVDDLTGTEVIKEKIEKKKEPSVPFFHLWRFSTSFERFLIFCGIIISGGIGTLMPVQILLFGGLINDIRPALEDPTEENLLRALVPIIKQITYLGAGMLVGGYLAQMIWVLTGELQTKRIRALYVHSILRQDMGWFDKAEDGSLNTRLSGDTQLVQDAISEKAGNTVQMIAQFVTGFVIAFVKGWRLAIVMFACLPLMGIVGAIMMTFITKLIAKGQDAYADAGAVAEQALAGIRTVYSFSIQKRFSDRYENLLKNAEVNTARAGIVVGWGFGLFMFLLFASYGLAFWYGAYLVVHQQGGMNAGNVLTVFLCMIMGAMGLMMVPPNLSAFANGRAAAFRIFQTIDRVPTIDSASDEGQRPKAISGHIQFKNIDFSYPSRPELPILKNFSLDVLPGKTVAFVGPSGSGKSTSVALVQRFYDPLNGQVSLDGIDLKDINVKYLRQQIGVVSQEPVLFNMSIRDNLMMGSLNPSITQSELEEACRKANCHAFITALPNGYDTLVGDHGGMLSGGQKQRIAIARALIKNPKILLLDEATSALDTQSERIVQRALDAASKDRTTIVIAHRLSTIRNADLIVVMEKGVLVEKGNHDELYAMGGVYTKLVDKQRIKMEEDPETKVAKEMDDKELEEALKKEQLEFAAGPTKQTGLAESVTSVPGSLPSSPRSDTDLILPEMTLKETESVKVTTRGGKKSERQKRIEEEERKKYISKQRAPLFRVLREMKSERHLLFIGSLAAMIAGLIFPIYGYIFSKIIVTLSLPLDEIAPGPMKGTNQWAFVLVMVGVAALFSIGIQLTSFEMAGARYTARLRLRTFQCLLRQEVGYFDMEDHSVGALTSNLSVDAAGVNEMVTKVWGDVIQLIVSSITAIVISFIYSWQLALVLLACAPFILISSALEAKVFQGFEDQTKKAYAESGETATEAFKTIRTVAALTREEYFEQRYDANIAGPHRLALRKAYLASLGYGAHQGFNMWTSAVGFYAGARFIGHGWIDFQDMFVVLLVLMISAGTIGRSSLFAAKFAKAKNCAINTFEIIDRKTEIDAEKPGKEVVGVDGNIKFKNIAFKYPARPDVDIFAGKFGFSVKPKQTVALVGPSGCGKSTTIGMLQRWYDPLSGTVSVDGTDVQSYQLKNLRSHMSIVSQEPVLFDLSIRENILYGTDRTDVTDAELDEVCKMANIYNFIHTELSKGYDTRVGDKGSQLSGGQKQRVAIARALIRRPKILLLDEATSALDSESEKLVQEAIDRSVEGRTVITIAHRLSTIQNADMICVVKDGRVIEQGKHFDLIAKNGLYKDLVNQQNLNALQ